MAELSEEDIEVGRRIFELQKLLKTDIEVAFGNSGILGYHMTALIGSIIEMLFRMVPPERRRQVWEMTQKGINDRFRDGRL